jgi:hypothetical protein
MRLRGQGVPEHVENRFSGGSVRWLFQAGVVHIHLPPLTVRSLTLRVVGLAALGSAGAVLLDQPGVPGRIAGVLLALLALGQLIGLLRAVRARRELSVPDSELTAAVALLARRLRESYDREEFRMEIDPAHADVARKTLNDLVAQTASVQTASADTGS